LHFQLSVEDFVVTSFFLASVLAGSERTVQAKNGDLQYAKTCTIISMVGVALSTRRNGIKQMITNHRGGMLRVLTVEPVRAKVTWWYRAP